jgi:hypothetical protein
MELRGAELRQDSRKAAGIPLVFLPTANTERLASLGPNESETQYYGAGRQRRYNLGGCYGANLSLASNRFALEGWEKIIPLLQDYQLSGNLQVQTTTVQGRLGKGATPQIQGTLTLSGVSAKPPQFPKPIKDLDTRIDFTGERAVFKDTRAWETRASAWRRRSSVFPSRSPISFRLRKYGRRIFKRLYPKIERRT